MIGRFWLLALLSVLLFSTRGIAQENFGKFIGDLNFQARGSGTFVLLDDYTYEDPEKKHWVAYKGLKTDCASIPIYLVPALGTPCLGDFRYAAIIHDRFCQDKEHAESPEVHRMFYYAMRAGGVSNEKAMIMYAGVYAGGPHWRHVRDANGNKSIEEYRLYWPSTWWERFKEAVGIAIAREDPDYLQDGLEEPGFLGFGKTVETVQVQPPEFEKQLQENISALLKKYE